MIAGKRIQKLLQLLVVSSDGLQATRFRRLAYCNDAAAGITLHIGHNCLRLATPV